MPSEKTMSISVFDVVLREVYTITLLDQDEMPATITPKTADLLNWWWWCWGWGGGCYEYEQYMRVFEGTFKHFLLSLYAKFWCIYVHDRMDYCIW